ncbi:DnaD domain protein [Turicibacter sanguinis]|nr:DnaD domain protein [Turicibacter sanguinis]MTN52201.1 DnaD domain protein [Turicibacter sanguinis]MTN55255.1 DnaD domain protein [Turicibacter sanguinis]MTN58477.1 DnaD domain protein [Turicibacter sanguinis]MTN61574.1 DnaD domain protein [Turicibacter sanguinis]
MNRDFKGIWIPREIWLSEDLSITEKVLLVEIDSLDNESGCFASNEYFAKFLKISKDRVSKLISGLCQKGYLKTTIIYKQGSKQIEKRILNTTIGYRQKQLDPLGENTDTPIGENAEDNNTRVNNTFNNTDYNCLLLQDTLNNISNRGEKSQKVVADNIYQFYQQNFGVLSPLIGEKLGGWVKDLGEELVKEALTKTLMNGSRNFSYAETIMREWYNKNIKTLEQVQTLELDYQRRRNQFPASAVVKSSEVTPRFGNVRRG